MKPESPVNTIPPIVIALTLLLAGIEVVLQLANQGIVGGPQGVGWRLLAVQEFGFSPVVLERVFERADYSFDLLKRFLTYPFISIDLTQMIFCAALTLALGKFAGEYYGGWQVLFVFLFSSFCGATMFGMMVDGRIPLYGGFTPIYGLIGAYTYALWLRLGQAGENQLRAFRLIGFLLLVQLMFGLVFGASRAWISELSGFVAGFGISLILAPGGWSAFVNRMRQRS